ncbi:hypothetical protein QVD17_31383 [Tagetes erecta]|uniref:Uncharacterized protein n=1 Tax=Tagetes erecta TaxID=13708 RepID=A0AAD8K9M7_TARER|nr:hypothetical protein QVD17_31383 [Tagetes erecta]
MLHSTPVNSNLISSTSKLCFFSSSCRGHRACLPSRLSNSTVNFDEKIMVLEEGGASVCFGVTLNLIKKKINFVLELEKKHDFDVEEIRFELIGVEWSIVRFYDDSFRLVRIFTKNKDFKHHGIYSKELQDLDCGSGERFLKFSSMKLPDTENALYSSNMSLVHKHICRKDMHAYSK